MQPSSLRVHATSQMKRGLKYNNQSPGAGGSVRRRARWRPGPPVPMGSACGGVISRPPLTCLPFLTLILALSLSSSSLPHSEAGIKKTKNKKQDLWLLHTRAVVPTLCVCVPQIMPASDAASTCGCVTHVHVGTMRCDDHTVDYVLT